MNVNVACTGVDWVSNEANKERIASNGHASTSTLHVYDVTQTRTVQHTISDIGPACEGTPYALLFPQ